MKRMMSLFMAVAFSLSMAGVALATDEIPVVSAENASVVGVEEDVQTPVVDKAEKKVKEKSAKKSAKKATKKTKKKKGEAYAAPAK